MLLNVIIGFIIPWITSLLILKDRKVIYYLAPFASVSSFIVNEIGFFHFWNLYPFKLHYLSAMPFNIGFFATYPCIMIKFMDKYHIKPYIILPITGLLVTLAETIGVLIGRVYYRNSWNIVATFFSYFITLIIIYGYYKLLKKQHII